MDFSPTIKLVTYRCSSCNRYYAVEERMRHQCPSCAVLEIERADERTYAAWNRAADANRKVSALRGVITRMKKRGERAAGKGEG